jgi:hypothetical protein
MSTNYSSALRHLIRAKLLRNAAYFTMEMPKSTGQTGRGPSGISRAPQGTAPLSWICRGVFPRLPFTLSTTETAGMEAGDCTADCSDLDAT